MFEAVLLGDRHVDELAATVTRAASAMRPSSIWGICAGRIALAKWSVTRAST
jgi:hypothetical protein